MSAKNQPVKTTYANAAGPMPVLLPLGASSDPKAAQADAAETGEPARQTDANRTVILRLMETVKGL